MRPKRLDLSLYLIVDKIHFREGLAEEQIARAIRGGVRAVQLRLKSCSTEEFEKIAKKLLEALKPFKIPLLINDRVEVAKKIGAQGVHLGQSDMKAQDARRLLGPDAIIGLSIESPEQIQGGGIELVDYLGVGPIFPTTSKKDIQRIWGLDGLASIRSMTSLPLVAIGGIQESNLASVVQAGADGIAVISAFDVRDDWAITAARLREQFESGKKRSCSKDHTLAL